MQKIHAVICDQCNVVIGKDQYYMIAGSELCSLSCYNDMMVVPVKKVVKKKKGKK
jgi:hypothetical protein